MQRETALAYIARYLLGTINLQDEHMLRHWVDADQANSELFEACFAAWEALEESGVGYKPNAEAAWDSFMDNFPKPASVPPSRAAFKLKTWVWMLPLLLLLGGGGFGLGVLTKPTFTTVEWQGGAWSMLSWEGMLSGDSLMLVPSMRMLALSDTASFEYKIKGDQLILRGLSGEILVVEAPEQFLLHAGFQLEYRNGNWTKTRD
ncbi:MAG: hypothetical protein AAFV07_05415 [Bacteroidota bacterium]